MVITIDGPAGSGKTLLTKKLATSLGYCYINSGNLYRSIAVIAHDAKIDPIQKNMIINLLSRQLFIEHNGTLVPKMDIPVERLRNHEIDHYTSVISGYAEIRDYITSTIRAFCKKRDVVCEGRDMATHVLPDAQWHFYVTADVNVRARRLSQMKGSDGGSDAQDMKQRMIERDKIDEERSLLELLKRPDIVVIDTTEYTTAEIKSILISMVKYGKSK